MQEVLPSEVGWVRRAFYRAIKVRLDPQRTVNQQSSDSYLGVTAIGYIPNHYDKKTIRLATDKDNFSTVLNVTIHRCTNRVGDREPHRFGYCRWFSTLVLLEMVRTEHPTAGVAVRLDDRVCRAYHTHSAPECVRRYFGPNDRTVGGRRKKSSHYGGTRLH